ncbi:MAG: hypothetical protein AB7V77_03165 [Candidatus Woesearchaeota archaeon]
MKRKAQTEIIGFIFIIIIISVVMLFYLSYSVEKQINPEKSILQTYKNTEVSFSFVQALLYTSNCGDSIEGLIKDCAKFKRINCGGKNSCEQINETVTTIINQTLDKWGLEYSFVIKFNSQYNLTYFTPNCEPGKIIVGQTAPGIYPIHLGTGQDALIELGICR